MSTYLAVDIGASSGRHIIGSLKNGKIELQEIYRFENKLVNNENTLCWDLGQLFAEILNGMKKCAALEEKPTSMGIDTWAVDFVLLDQKGSVIGKTAAYRDSRTSGMDKKVYDIIPAHELYQRTGIQMQIFNTIYQLMYLRENHPEELAKAKSFLMVPEYFNYLLTGFKMNEYTNATTTQLVNAQTKTWDTDLLNRLGIPTGLFGTLQMPQTSVGRLRPEIADLIGFDCEVVLPATHDTGSAVLSVPATDDDFIYLSSGTWSLIGTERMEPDCSESSRKNNFTNEGGIDYRYRHLKNIMGLWIIQSVKRELGGSYSFDDLCTLAREASHFQTLIDVNDGAFLAPKSMISAIKDYCTRNSLQKPETTGELMACVYNSLAASYAKAIAEIEDMAGRHYSRLHIVGGGTKDSYLNELTAKYTGKAVYTGPTEATAVGNLLAQMLKAGDFSSIKEARTCVAQSFGIKKVEG